MIVTDSGLHIWQAPTPDNPWNPKKAHVPTPIGYEDLRRMMAEAGVDRAILVPPSFAGGKSDYSIEAAKKYPDLFAVMAALKLNKPDSRETLEHLLTQPHVLGVRLTFHHDHDESYIRDGTADWFWPIAEAAKMPVMMNAPTVQKDVAKVAERYPNIRIIIDHIGRKKKMKDDKFGQAVADTLELAKHPNVFVKLTNVPTNSTQDYPYRNIHDVLKRTIDTFGPRRCFWGTDISSMMRSSKCTYRQAVTMFTEEMDFLSKDDLEWVMGRGLAECLPWPVSPSLAKKAA